MNIHIRRAERQDCARLLELVQELATYERAPSEVSVTLEHFIESGFGEKPVWWALVAECDEKVVGFALYYIRYSTWKGQATGRRHKRSSWTSCGVILIHALYHHLPINF